MFRLVREGVSTADAINDQHVWPLRFTATKTEDDSPAKIFVIQASADDLADASFSCVANAAQMTDLPADDAQVGAPFYRSSVAELYCRSAEAADEAVEAIESAVQNLVDNLAMAENLSVLDTVTITPSNA